MEALRQAVSHYLRGGPGELSVCSVAIEEGRECYRFEYESDAPMMAASIAKLGIALYAAELVASRMTRWSKRLVLKEEHKRGGTGVLRHFPAGTPLSLRQAVMLMLAESDNTAANVVLGHVGPQAMVDNWLRSRGIGATGLVPRRDRRYESGKMSARDALNILLLIDREAPLLLEWMRRSHSVDGLRGDLERHSRWDRAHYLRSGALGGFVPPVSPALHLGRPVVEYAARRPQSPVAANKEGLLEWEGHRYRHDAARIGLAPGRPYLLIAAFTRDADPALLPALGRAAAETIAG